MIINGVSTIINATASGGQSTTSVVSHTANLNSGSNSVVIEHIDGWTCYDYIDVTGDSGGQQNSQSISFSSLGVKTVGDANFNLNATASSGLPVSYSTSDSSVASISGSTVTILTAGSAIITASQAGNSNYSAAPNVQRTLTVNASGNGNVSTSRFEGESASLNNAVSENWRMTNPSGGQYAYIGNDLGATISFTVNAISVSYTHLTLPTTPYV